MATEADVRALLDQVKSGSTFEALRASEQLAKIGQRRSRRTNSSAKLSKLAPRLSATKRSLTLTRSFETSSSALAGRNNIYTN